MEAATTNAAEMIDGLTLICKQSAPDRHYKGKLIESVSGGSPPPIDDHDLRLDDFPRRQLSFVNRNLKHAGELK